MVDTPVQTFDTAAALYDFLGVANTYVADGIAAHGTLDREAFGTMRDSAYAKYQDFLLKQTEEGNARGTMDLAMRELRDVFLLYKPTCQDRIPDSVLLGTVPSVGRADMADREFLMVGLEFLNHHGLVDTSLGANPMKVKGKTRAQIKTQYDTYTSLVGDASNKKQLLRAARAESALALVELISAMVALRVACRIALSDHPEVLALMPKVWEHSDGRPDPVFLTVDADGHLHWSRSDAADFKAIHFRYRAGNSVPTARDALLATITDQDQTTYDASALLLQGDGHWSVRGWVEDAGGHIAASNVVLLSRTA